jgi:cysteinyl-tRNA synthetase
MGDGKSAKMSKSLGNGLSVDSVLNGHHAWAVRYALSAHCRSMIEWSDGLLTEAESVFDTITRSLERSEELAGRSSTVEVKNVSVHDLPARFTAALNDDLSTMTVLVKTPASLRALTVRAMLDVLGLDPMQDPWIGDGDRDGNDALGKLVDAELEDRGSARSAGDWSRADAIRDRLTSAGIVIRDDKNSTTWSAR